MSVYLEDHPPARSQFINPRRAKASGAIVVHTGESITDLLAPDYGAESLARFISTRTDAGSYHSIVDADSIVHVGKYEWEMFHEGTGGNKWSLGLSFACRADDWPTLPTWWVNAALINGAKEAVNMIRWVKATTGIIVPANHIGPSDYRSLKAGFIGHGELDPGRRHDPGDQFPWQNFLNLVNLYQEEDDVADPYLTAWTRIEHAYRFHLGRMGSPEEIDGWAGAAVRGSNLDGVIKEIANSPEAQAYAARKAKQA